MSLHKRIAVACALASVALVSAVSLTSAQGKKGQKKPPASAAPSKAQIEAGKEVYMANGCAACHKIGDKGGATGPELTKIGKTMKADKLKALIRDPKKAKADAKMPAYGSDKINDKDMTALLAYLGSLK